MVREGEVFYQFIDRKHKGNADLTQIKRSNKKTKKTVNPQ
jgi:hypothetical protein